MKLRKLGVQAGRQRLEEGTLRQSIRCGFASEGGLSSSLISLSEKCILGLGGVVTLKATFRRK